MKIITALIIICVSGSLFAQAGDTTFSSYEQIIPGYFVKIKMVPVKAGSFKMGSPETEKERDGDEGPQKTFSVSPFWMSAYEVTYDEYNTFFLDETFSRNTDADAVTRPSPPYIDFTLSMGKEGGYPANSMQQYGALMFCRWLYKKTGIFFRLPTEAEWEYACRAGSSGTYPFGNNEGQLDQYAWYGKNSGGSYHKVGQLKPNGWGLYDMMGNVGEWTLDQYEEKYFEQLKDTTVDPVIPSAKRHPHTVKGGTFKDDAKELRPANRRASDPVWNRRDPQIPKSKWWNADAPFIGFRILRPVKQPAPAEAEKFFDLYLIK